MPSFRDLLGFSFYPLRIKNTITRYLTHKPAYRLRVLSYHDMSEPDEALFERQLRWVMKSWDIVEPAVFAAMIDGEIPVKRDSLLLTFDDGTISNLHVAERVLRPLGIHAIFFVVGRYALLSERDDWREFAARNIILNRHPNNIPANFQNMSIRDLKALLEAGHTIGAHTATHARLSHLKGPQLQDEIVGGADLLEVHLKSSIQHFAYPFGDFRSLSAEASHIARRRFKYVYTGMRGNNSGLGQTWSLWRDSNDPHDLLWFTGACLEGGADFLYKKNRDMCETW